jgi:hypothetical protein
MTKKSKSQNTTPVVSSPDVRIGSNVSATNQVLGEVRGNHKQLFEVVKDAYTELSTKEFKEYRSQVDLDVSTFNKIVKIIENDTISKFMDRLPISWGSLYALTSMDATDLVNAIEDGSINARTTLKDINGLKGTQSRSVQKGADKDSDVGEVKENCVKVDLNALGLSKDQENEVKSLLLKLHNFGISVSGVDLVDRLDAIDRLAA